MACSIKGIFGQNTSPYGAPILFVDKKDGNLRMCIDYHVLNKITIKNNYHMPCINNLLDWFNWGKYFYWINVKFHYYQNRIVDEAIQKTAMRTKYGLYGFLVMPFGLGNAPINIHKLHGLYLPWKVGWIRDHDDILVYSKIVEEHVEHLEDVLSNL
jgi:hypothetical protein